MQGIDIWQAAVSLADNDGAKATMFAARRANGTRIAWAIEALQRPKPYEGTAIH
jgi:hypothetical protein